MRAGLEEVMRGVDEVGEGKPEDHVHSIGCCPSHGCVRVMACNAILQIQAATSFRKKVLTLLWYL